MIQISDIFYFTEIVFQIRFSTPTKVGSFYLFVFARVLVNLVGLPNFFSNYRPSKKHSRVTKDNEVDLKTLTDNGFLVLIFHAQLDVILLETC